MINVNSALLGTLETLDHSFALKVKLNTTAAWFMKVIVRVVKTMSVKSVRNIVFRWSEHKDPNKQSQLAQHLKYFPDHQLE